MAGEVAIIVLWALFVTRPYQNFDANLVPTGREYLSAIQTHHLWDWSKPAAHVPSGMAHSAAAHLLLPTRTAVHCTRSLC